MKILRNLSVLGFGISLALLSGCGKSDDAASAAPAGPAPQQSPQTPTTPDRDRERPSDFEIARSRYIRIVIQDRNSRVHSLNEKIAACDRVLEEADRIIRAENARMPMPRGEYPRGRELRRVVEEVEANKRELEEQRRRERRPRP